MMIKWLKINQFYQVVKQAEYDGNQAMNYAIKVKLHGTNAAVEVLGAGPGQVRYQSRNRYITPDDDNSHFANWAQHVDWTSAEGFTLFGEWVGPGINRGVAISQIPRRAFCVFGAWSHGAERWLVNPSSLRPIVPEHKDIRIIPWHFHTQVEFSEGGAQEISEEVDRVEAHDPLALGWFGVDGPGEGLVYYPTAGSGCTPNFARYVFKAKGQQHRVLNRRPAVADLDIADLSDYLDTFVTEGRLAQAVAEVGGPTRELTGAFLAWVCRDVAEESKGVLIEKKWTTKQVTRHVAHRAREWWLDKV